MKKARAWSEEVFYYECPHCEETVELGTEVVFGDTEEETCEKCEKKFMLEPPRSEEERRRSAWVDRNPRDE